MAMDDRYNRSDLGRQDRYQDFDHRDRSRYQDDMMMDRRDNARGMGGNRDGQVRSRPQGSLNTTKLLVFLQNQWNPEQKSFNLEGGLKFVCLTLQHFSDRGERHGRDGRESWSGGFDKRMNTR